MTRVIGYGIAINNPQVPTIKHQMALVNQYVKEHDDLTWDGVNAWIADLVDHRPFPFYERPGGQHIFTEASPGDHLVIATSWAFGSWTYIHKTAQLFDERKLTLAIADMRTIDTRYKPECYSFIVDMAQFSRRRIRKLYSADPPPLGWEWGVTGADRDKLFPCNEERELAKDLQVVNASNRGDWRQTHREMRARRAKVREEPISRAMCIKLWVAHNLGFPQVVPAVINRYFRSSRPGGRLDQLGLWSPERIKQYWQTILEGASARALITQRAPGANFVNWERDDDDELDVDND